MKEPSNSKQVSIPDASQMKFGIVISEWNAAITSSLHEACKKVLVEHGAKPKNIISKNVPGSFELPLGAQMLYESHKVDAVICLGCIIQGETRHFDFICEAVSNGIMQLNLKYNAPFIFGVLTPNNMEQAKQRAGGKLGNKGIEAALTAIKMVAIKAS